ncbi:hypothetical protein jhhlp_008225 [Lomentospora prolificans]|uniref:Rhodopsin domain-containing protein n=1 Tax=Lomentospora prolificans TaxID=41688 RepID=A0A2N3MXE6_9PEZI|nr:hypothetical protein jhhlp_008225 [Lomentospora prolificans]
MLVLLGMCSTTLAITSQSWSKTSFALTLLSVSDGWMSYFLWFAILSINILLGLGALFFWVSCTPLDKAWHPLVEGTCWDPSIIIMFGIISSVYSGFMDLTFSALAWKIILPLNLNIREKMACGVAMSMGVFAGVAAFIKASKIPSIDPNNGQDSMQLAIWGVAEPAVTIMAASVPALRLLIGKITEPKLKESDGEA